MRAAIRTLPAPQRSQASRVEVRSRLARLDSLGRRPAIESARIGRLTSLRAGVPPATHGRSDFDLVLVRLARIEVEESLAGEIVGHRLADGAQLLEEPGVLPDQSLALVFGQLEDVGIEPASPAPGRKSSRAA